MITENEKLGLTQGWRACISRIKDELKAIDKMSIEDFEAEYQGATLQGARENLQGQIIGYMVAVKSVDSLA